MSHRLNDNRSSFAGQQRLLFVERNANSNHPGIISPVLSVRARLETHSVAKPPLPSFSLPQHSLLCVLAPLRETIDVAVVAVVFVLLCPLCEGSSRDPLCGKAAVVAVPPVRICVHPRSSAVPHRRCRCCHFPEQSAKSVDSPVVAVVAVTPVHICVPLRSSAVPRMCNHIDPRVAGSYYRWRD